MGLVIGKHYSGDPKQKPKQFGPASVASSVFGDRIEDWFDVPRSSVLGIFPCWGPGSQSNLGFSNTSASNFGVDYKGGAHIYAGDGYLDLGTGTEWFLKTFTFIVDIRLETNPSAVEAVLSRSGTSGQRIFHCAFTTDGTLRLFHDTETKDSSDSIALGRSTVIAWARNNSTKKVRFFLDGNEDSAGEQTFTSALPSSSSNPFRIGRAGNSSTEQYLNGIISSILLFSDYLESTKVAAIKEKINLLFMPPTFRTYSFPSGTIAINYPTNGSTNITQPITFSWSSVTDAVSYQLQVADTEAGLDTLPEIDTTITAPTTTKDIDGLDPSTIYYSRVRAET